MFPTHYGLLLTLYSRFDHLIAILHPSEPSAFVFSWCTVQFFYIQVCSIIMHYSVPIIRKVLMSYQIFRTRCHWWFRLVIPVGDVPRSHDTRTEVCCRDTGASRNCTSVEWWRLMIHRYDPCSTWIHYSMLFDLIFQYFSYIHIYIYSIKWICYMYNCDSIYVKRIWTWRNKVVRLTGISQVNLVFVREYLFLSEVVWLSHSKTQTGKQRTKTRMRLSTSTRTHRHRHSMNIQVPLPCTFADASLDA